MPRPLTRLTGPLALAAIILAAGACSQTPVAPAKSADQAAAPPKPHIRIDGDLSDWPAGTAMYADANYLYFRLHLPEAVTLQGAPYTLALMVDLDADAATGKPVGRQPHDPPSARPLGADLEVDFSPVKPGASSDRPPDRGQAVRVDVTDDKGDRVDVSHAAIDLLFAPTYASDDFEIRISRHLEGISALPTIVEQAPAAASRFLVISPKGAVIGASEPVAIRLEPPAAHAPLADVSIPAAASDELRIVSFNMLFASPTEHPEPFARLIRALKPDVVLCQEWDKRGDADHIPADAVAKWFNDNVPGLSSWHALKSDGWGVAIVSRFPMSRLGPEHLGRTASTPADTHISDRAIRFVGALINSPVGDAAVASVHLKCCGYKDSPEDQTRMAEADLINAAFGGALADVKTPLRVIAGDMNLVGSRPPVDILRHGLDTDGSDLAIARTRVLGDGSIYTWSDPTSAFTPGRLDYVMTGHARCRVVRAFVLDVDRLSDAALARAGLERSDAHASDHRPVVVDIKPVR